jgi:hypothetical protein
MDVNGRTLISRTFKSQPITQMSFDVSRLPEGVYFLKMTDEEGGMPGTQKIVIRRGN